MKNWQKRAISLVFCFVIVRDTYLHKSVSKDSEILIQNEMYMDRNGQQAHVQ